MFRSESVPACADSLVLQDRSAENCPSTEPHQSRAACKMQALVRSPSSSVNFLRALGAPLLLVCPEDGRITQFPESTRLQV